MKDFSEEVFGRIVRSIDALDPSEDLREIAEHLGEYEDTDRLQDELLDIANAVENREEILLELGEEQIQEIIAEVIGDDLWMNTVVENMSIEGITELLEMVGEVTWDWNTPDETICPSCNLSARDRSSFTQRIIELEIELRQLKDDHMHLESLNAELISRLHYESKRTSKTHDAR